MPSTVMPSLQRSADLRVIPKLRWLSSPRAGGRCSVPLPNSGWRMRSPWRGGAIRSRPTSSASTRVLECASTTFLPTEPSSLGVVRSCTVLRRTVRAIIIQSYSTFTCDSDRRQARDYLLSLCVERCFAPSRAAMRLGFAHRDGAGSFVHSPLWGVPAGTDRRLSAARLRNDTPAGGASCCASWLRVWLRLRSVQLVV